jgi:hypothetical protein
MPIARSKPPVPPNTSLLFGHNATALLPHRASYRRNIRLRIGQRAYSDRLLGLVVCGAVARCRRRDRAATPVALAGVCVSRPARSQTQLPFARAKAAAARNGRESCGPPHPRRRESPSTG